MVACSQDRNYTNPRMVLSSIYRAGYESSSMTEYNPLVQMDPGRITEYLEDAIDRVSHSSCDFLNTAFMELRQ